MINFPAYEASTIINTDKTYMHVLTHPRKHRHTENMDTQAYTYKYCNTCTKTQTSPWMEIMTF